MDVSMGAMSQVVLDVQAVAKDLTSLYGKIIMITGTDPDVLRDYMLEKRMKGIGARLTDMSESLASAAARVYAIAGGRAAEAVTLETMAVQLDSLARDPDTIPSRLATFRDNLSDLSTWILEMGEQPLDIDYFLLAPPEMPLPRANPDFLTALKDGFTSFRLSFLKDATNLGNVYDGGALTVWAFYGQEQAAVAKALIDEVFTGETGIPVNLNVLTNTDTLLFSASSGAQPDVVLNVGGALPVDYGVRGALKDLQSLPGIDEVLARFHPSSYGPFEYDSKLYALPIAQSFPVLFYRTDIFEALGLEPPETWEDAYAAIAVLQEHNMTMGVPQNYDMMLLQNGGQYFSDDMMKCLFDSPEGIEAFERLTNMYTHYGLPQEYEFYNRFRTGEMPVGIDDFMLYNEFRIAAPEIKGLWDVAMLPGTRRADGSVSRLSPASASAAMIFEDTPRTEEAWAFLQWYLDADAQIRFGRDIEAVLGTGARYNSANLTAIQSLSWPTETLNTLMKQRDESTFAPIIPGSYYVSRHVGNAFREVVTLGELPREAMSKYVESINSEIRKKREEFGLKVE
jgi:ABC-type glycerol-3-phosphate transport system substrate-binding protein